MARVYWSRNHRTGGEIDPVMWALDSQAQGVVAALTQRVRASPPRLRVVGVPRQAVTA